MAHTPCPVLTWGLCVCVGGTTAWPRCSSLCGLSAAGLYSNAHSLHIIVSETKRGADVRETRMHTHCREQARAPVCSRTISIAAVWANRLWQCFAVAWLGGTGNIQLEACTAGMEKTKKTVLLSKRTTRSSGRWEKAPPFPLVSEQKRFTLVYLNESIQLQETEANPSQRKSLHPTVGCP